MENIANEDLNEALDFVLGLKSQPQEGLGKYYKLLISELYINYSNRVFEALLEEQGSTVACDGLMILSEIGEKGRDGTDLALMHVDHPDWTARFYLADHLLSCNYFLNVSQISMALPLSSDDKVDVRCKMMELLSKLDSAKIIEAVNTKTGNSELYKEAAGILSRKTFSSDDFDHIYQKSQPILITFAGARILRDWREGINSEPINVHSDQYDIVYLGRKFKKLARKNA